MYRVCVTVAEPQQSHKEGPQIFYNVQKTGVTLDHTVPMVLHRSRQNCQHQGFQNNKHGHAVDADTDTNKDW